MTVYCPLNVKLLFEKRPQDNCAKKILSKFELLQIAKKFFGLLQNLRCIKSFSSFCIPIQFSEMKTWRVFAICINTISKWDKYILQLVQLHFEIKINTF